VSDITAADLAAAGFGGDPDFDQPADEARALTGMQRFMLGYYDQSYPLSITKPATGATAGIPGAFTPPGCFVPTSVANLIAGVPHVVVASPATAWTTGQYVQTQTAGAPGQAHWTGTAWAAAPALLEEGESRPRRRKNGNGGTATTTEPEPEPDEPVEPEPTEPEQEESPPEEEPSG
jgi:hypothetical protein